MSGKATTSAYGLVLLSLILVISICVAWSGAGAGAGTAAFEPIPAAKNISALQAAPAPSVPAAVLALPAEMRSGEAIRELGGGVGYGWLREDGSVCLLMSGGPGGCLTTFRKPVLLYLAGTRSAAGIDSELTVWGLVPDEVAKLSLVTEEGKAVQADISANAFMVTLPPDTSIAGEQVTLTNGRSFYQDDPLSGDPAPPPVPGGG